MMKDSLLPVTKVQRFCTHDGPGVRTTVFLKGCPLHCLWCHNPETQSPEKQFFYADAHCIRCGACAQVCDGHTFENDVHRIDRDQCRHCMQCADHCPAGALEPCQRMMTEDMIVAEVLRDRAFYTQGGGVTLSGGEPMYHKEKTLSLLAALKKENIHTALETCGHFDAALLPDLVKVTDLFLWDIKDTVDERHKAYTGVSTALIHKNLLHADALGAKTILRCILVKDVNTDEAHLKGIAALYGQLRHCLGVELIPYHTFGEGKQTQLGAISQPHPEWIPDKKTLASVRRYLRPLVRLL